MPQKPSSSPSDVAALEPPSILILTKDEELNIAECLRCFDFADDIVVLDSYSTDRTVEIAKQFPNVRVLQRKFDTWSKHSNWAVTNIDFKHPWVYYSDADERMPAELRDEIKRVINDTQQPYNAYRLRYKNMFLGKWIRRGGLYPVWIIRLFKPDKIRYEDRQVNAHPIVDGELGDLREHFIHYSFNKGLVPWFHKHNSYSEMESHEAFQVFRESFMIHLKRALGKEPYAVRRRAIKNMSFYLPWRGLVRFLYMYILKLGFLDGRPGLTYAAMISMYEYWIELKVIEGRNHWREKTDETAERMLAEGA